MDRCGPAGTVGSGPVRVLVTNDDGVGAPGLAALTRALVGWVDTVATGGGATHEIVVVAPSSNYSGAGAAVGSVEDRTAIPYVRATVEGAEGVEAYGLDASPALSVIAGALGAVGPKPDLVLSGINHGVNVGRSVLHSGTVGAALTASQLGIERAGRLARRRGDPRSPLGVGRRPGGVPHPRAGRGAGADRAQPQRPGPAPARDPRRALGPGQRRRPHQGGPRRRRVGRAQPDRDGGTGGRRRRPGRHGGRGCRAR